MNREIKFRAWNEEANRYSKPFGIKSSVISFTDDDGLGVVKSLTNEVVEQFTGLKDKNGKEIYEGDYLVDRYPINEEDLSLGYNESLLPVVWCKKQLMWCVDASFKKDGSFLTSLVEYFGEFLETKGNIHE